MYIHYHHDLCFSPFSRRSYFACQIQECVVLIIFVRAQRAKTHHRFFLSRFWEATWPQNNSFSSSIISVIQGTFPRLTPPCSEDGGCGVMANHILQYGFVGQFLWRCLFLPQPKYKSFVDQSFHLSDPARVYCQVTSRFIGSLAGTLVFTWAGLLVVGAVGWGFMGLNKWVEILYWRSSSIH